MSQINILSALLRVFFFLPIPVPLVYLDWDVYMSEHYLCFFTITEAWARDWLIVSPHTRWYLDEGIRWEVHSNRIRILWSSPFRGSRQGVRKRCTCDKWMLGRTGRLGSEDLVESPFPLLGILCVQVMPLQYYDLWDAEWARVMEEKDKL